MMNGVWIKVIGNSKSGIDMIKEPKISVCKRNRKFKIACMDGFEFLNDFIEYDDEEFGIECARQYFIPLTDKEPKIVRPVITKMIMRSSKRKH